jgi:hypothetical protein
VGQGVGVSFDISKLLGDWEFNPGQILVRRFKGEDGTDKIQLRLDLGILQMNSEGRPDGKRPHDFGTIYEYYLERKAKAEGEFKLTEEDCSSLQLEAIQYHHRGLCLCQLEDYEAVLLDTQHTLNIFMFIDEYAEEDVYLWSVVQWSPQVMMMHTRAKSALALKADKFEESIEIIETGMEQIRMFYSENTDVEDVESCDEIQILKDYLDDLRAQRPVTESERLEKAMSDAIQREDYEKAAFFRDALRKLQPPKTKKRKNNYE